jgi:hypothetical protein
VDTNRRVHDPLAATTVGPEANAVVCDSLRAPMRELSARGGSPHLGVNLAQVLLTLGVCLATPQIELFHWHYPCQF